MSFIEDHIGVLGIFAYWLFSAIVGGMPPPTEKSGTAYVWSYGSLHILAGNLTSAVRSRYPALPAGAAAAEQTTTTTVVSK
jgi:hypothetical protein